MTDALAIMDRLDKLADELDRRSRELADCERELEPVKERYESFIDGYEVGLWEAHVKDDAKLPSESMRLKLARRDMDPMLLGRYGTLSHRSKRLEKRLSSLKAAVSAQQSLLSAAKSEMEATRA